MGKFYVDFQEKSGGLRGEAPKRGERSPSLCGLSVENLHKICPARLPGNSEGAISD
jgi:hypothetical protein